MFQVQRGFPERRLQKISMGIVTRSPVKTDLCLSGGNHLSGVNQGYNRWAPYIHGCTGPVTGHSPDELFEGHPGKGLKLFPENQFTRRKAPVAPCPGQKRPDGITVKVDLVVEQINQTASGT
jgi:hypothetical protein